MVRQPEDSGRMPVDSLEWMPFFGWDAIRFCELHLWTFMIPHTALLQFLFDSSYVFRTFCFIYSSDMRPFTYFSIQIATSFITLSRREPAYLHLAVSTKCQPQTQSAQNMC